MTVGELRRILDSMEAAGRITDDTDVLVMTQQSYPLQSETHGLVTAGMIAEGACMDLEGKDVLWIVEGQQLGYGDSAAWEFADMGF